MWFPMMLMGSCTNCVTSAPVSSLKVVIFHWCNVDKKGYVYVKRISMVLAMAFDWHVIPLWPFLLHLRHVASLAGHLSSCTPHT